MTDRDDGDFAALAPSRAALARARRTTRAVADDLLTHLPDVGDPAAQRLLDAWVEQATDTARALSEALEERLVHRAPSFAEPTAGSCAADGSAPQPSPAAVSVPGAGTTT